MLRRAGSESKPRIKSGEERWKKLRAWDCRTWASPKMRRSFSAARGMRTASSASQALAEAIRWLTGQMPQMRAMSDGISENGRPSQNFSKPRNWVTWKRASSTRPWASRCRVILPWPSMRVTGLMEMVLRVVAVSGTALSNVNLYLCTFLCASRLLDFYVHTYDPKRVRALRSGLRPSSNSQTA